MTGPLNKPGVGKPGASFRDRLAACVTTRRALVVPGAANALSARVIADLGFEAVYVTGAGVTNMYLGLPDMGFLNLDQLAEHTAAIRDALTLPVIVDADTGFGNALAVCRTVRVLQRAGANVIQFEDQVSPKRCGHFAGKDVIPAEEMVGKIHAAVDARTSEELQIIARTDARAVESLQASGAVARGPQRGEVRKLFRPACASPGTARFQRQADPARREAPGIPNAC